MEVGEEDMAAETAWEVLVVAAVGAVAVTGWAMAAANACRSTSGGTGTQSTRCRSPRSCHRTLRSHAADNIHSMSESRSRGLGCTQSRRICGTAKMPGSRRKSASPSLGARGDRSA